MTKFLPLTLLCMLMCMSLLSAQSTGNFTISAGVGLTPTYHGKTASTKVLPVSVAVGYNVSKTFNLGLFAGYTEAVSAERILSDGLASSMENKTTAYGFRGEFRREWTDRFEVYGGMLLGYQSFDITEFNTRTGEVVVRDPEAPTPYNPNAPTGQFMYAGYVGARYFVSQHVGMFTELGCGLSLLQAGATIKF